MFDWLKSSLGIGPDHPMYNADAAAKLLAGLPPDAPKALEEITSWLDTVATAEGFVAENRLAVIKLLDESGQSREPQLLRDFLGKPGLKDFERLSLWHILVGFWEQLANAYRVCVAEMPPATASPGERAAPERVTVIARAVRALANEAKLLQMRYLPVRPQIWRALAELHALTETEKLGFGAIKIYPQDAVPSNPQLEFVRALMLDVSGPETEQPHHLELAARVIARLAAGFAFSPRHGPGCNLYFDLAHPDRPVHVGPKAPASASIRYFGAGKVILAIQEIIDRHTQHPDEPERRFGDDFSNEEKLILLKHLLLHWSDTPPSPREPQVKIDAHIKLGHGFTAACELVTRVEFSGMAEMTEDQRIKVKEQTGITLETKTTSVPLVDWVERDASRWGIGVDIPRQDEPWARIGTLCTFQPAGLAAWWLGVIRRLYRDAEDHEHAGIEVIAKKPLSVWLRGIGEGEQRAENWATSSGSFEFTYLPAVILGDGRSPGGGQEMLVAHGSFIAGIAFEVMMGEKMPQVRYDELVERGADFDRVRVTWLKTD